MASPGFSPPGVVGTIDSPRTSANGRSSPPSVCFTHFPDYARLNSARHPGGRTDTFNTPRKLVTATVGKASPSPANVGLDAKGVMDICQLSFAKSIRDLHSNLLSDLKGELYQALLPLREELAATVADSRAVASLQQIEHRLEVLEMPPVDLGPIGQDIKAASTEQSDYIQAMERQVSRDITVVQKQMETLRQQQLEVGQRVETQVANLEDMIRNTHFRILKVIEMQENLKQTAGQAIEELHSTQLQSLKQSQDLSESLDRQLTRYVVERPVNVDFGRVVHSMRENREAVSSDITFLLKEISKIQQALNVDFVSLVDLRVDSKARVDKVVRTTSPKDFDSLNKTSSSRARPTLMHQNSPTFSDPNWRPPLSSQLRKRYRDTGTGTDGPVTNEAGAQTDKDNSHRKSHRAKKEIAKVKKKMSRQVSGELKAMKRPRASKAVFADAEDMKAKARANLMKPQYNVHDFYHTKGCSQAVAKSPWFDNITLVLIVLNAIWIAVDADLNPEPVLYQAPILFQIVENMFCVYFSGELLIRFAAFKRKRNCIKDFWFVFDALLVSMMVLETWLLTIVMVASGGTVGAELGKGSILRVLRGVKMLRLSRMARLLRSVPELVILMKGVKAASRSVFVFFGMWLILVYIFALVFRQLSSDDSELFESVPTAMNNLLLGGILPSQASLINGAASENWIFWPLMLAFVSLAVLVLSNMLIGVLVEAVGAIAIAEKEGMTVMHLASELRRVYEANGFSPESMLLQSEFEKLIVSPAAATIIEAVGVDVVLLIDMAPNLFEDLARAGELGLSFEQFVELVLNMRETNPAKVKDLKEQLRIMKVGFKELQRDTQTAMITILQEIKGFKGELEEWRDADSKARGDTMSDGTSSEGSLSDGQRASQSSELVDD